MIELNTGVPGSGKTLNMVQRLSRLVKNWEKNPQDARPIFVLGIPNLLIPHAELPLISVQINKAGSPSLVPDWDSVPNGSLVLIDEAQGVFPPRSSASSSPSHVAWLNTHRHRGFDIWLTTQHPKLIDATVRALVGRHQHFRRLFGMQRATIYEWDACSDSLNGVQSAVRTQWAYPKDIFQFYKSAEIHTKQQFKLPKWILILPIGILMGLYFVPTSISKVNTLLSPEKKQQKNIVQDGAIAPVPHDIIDNKSYFMNENKCYSITKSGLTTIEPHHCRLKL